MLTSELDQINGIGPKTKEILLRQFGSVDKIKEAGPDQLDKLIGTSKSQIITKYFNEQSNFSTWNNAPE